MLNQVQLIGNLGNDPDIRMMPSGDPIATFSLATTRKWKDKSTGEKKSETEWHRVTIFGALAKVVEQYVRKGSKLYIQGRIKTTKYQKDGKDQYSTGIIGEQMIMLDSKQDGASSYNEPKAAARPAPANNQRQPARQAQPQGYDDFDDDIPFMSLNTLIKNHLF